MTENVTDAPQTRETPDGTVIVAPPGQASGNVVLTLACPDRPGIVRDVSAFLAGREGNIVESQQFGDQQTGRFFMRIDVRIAVRSVDDELDLDGLRAAFQPVAQQYDMEFDIWLAKAPYSALIMVSKQLHCLNDLLFRWWSGSLQIEIPAVVSNHRAAETLCDVYGLEFHHVPVTAESKDEAEAQLVSLIETHAVDVVVLARYMQVLSDDLCRNLPGRIINIHHSFLPSFKGARPYGQAYDRGVKLVGATAHYVTADLDEGPIIEQDIMRVDHTYHQDQLTAAGRDVEAQVLSRALRWHSESRVLLNGNRTVVFR